MLMHFIKSYFLLSGINLLSFSSIHCPLSSVFANMEKKALNFFGVFVFLVISLLVDVLLEMSNPCLYFFSNHISLNLPINPSNFAILFKIMPLLLHKAFEGNSLCC